MASLGLIAAVVGGIGAGVAAERTGNRTPGGDLLRSAGADVSGGAVGDGIDVPELLSIDTGLDQVAIDAARSSEAERIKKRRGRASTIVKTEGGVLGSPTTSDLLGS